MRNTLPLVFLGASVVAIVWAGCDDNETTTDATTAGPSGPSTGTMNPTTTVTTTTTTGPGGAGGALPGDPCNPVTNEGCDTAAGEACDTNFTASAFQCYPAPNENEICTACGSNDGFCEATHTCHDATCAKYCCTDADCSASAHCDYAYLADFPGTVGVCLTGGGGGQGGGGQGGGGQGGGGQGGGGQGGGGQGGGGQGGQGGTPGPVMNERLHTANAITQHGHLRARLRGGGGGAGGGGAGGTGGGGNGGTGG